jgi:hypothetical protein
MVDLKKFTDELAKHKTLVYFFVFWGLSFIFWSLCNFAAFGFGFFDMFDVLWILAYLMELLAGIMLLIFGLRLLGVNLLSGTAVGRFFVYFLILWGASFVFWGLYDILDLSFLASDPLCYLGGLADFFAGIMLVVFAWGLTTKIEEPKMEMES